MAWYSGSTWANHTDSAVPRLRIKQLAVTGVLCGKVPTIFLQEREGDSDAA
jgi:hypothetical protein